VKTLVNTSADAPLTTVVYMDTANGVTNPATVTDSDPLQIILPGVEVPASQGQGYSSFTWTAVNNQSQDVNQGVYYIKVEETDDYGHTTALIKEVTVLKREQYVELNIFNSSGEIVRSIRQPKDNLMTDKIDLSTLPDVIIVQDDGTLVDTTGAPVTVKYGSNLGENMQWDGKDQQGTVVSNGTYEIQVIMKTDQGSLVQSSKTVVVLRQDKVYLDKLVIAPNPFDKNSGGFVTFKWLIKNNGTEFGSTTIHIYNVAGELVRTLSGNLADSGLAGAGIKWDLKTAQGSTVSRGFYVCVLQAKDAAGHLDRKIATMAVQGYKY
jgi:flagellar hook assembly protein FlgD